MGRNCADWLAATNCEIHVTSIPIRALSSPGGFQLLIGQCNLPPKPHCKPSNSRDNCATAALKTPGIRNFHTNNSVYIIGNSEGWCEHLRDSHLGKSTVSKRTYRKLRSTQYVWRVSSILSWYCDDRPDVNISLESNSLMSTRD